MCQPVHTCSIPKEGIRKLVSVSVSANENVTGWMTAMRKAYRRHVEFETAVTRERASICHIFNQTLELLTAMQRDALLSFDAQVCGIRKRQSVDLVSMEVSGNQAAVAMGSSVAPSPFPLDVSPVAVPKFVYVPLQDLQTVLGASWSVETPVAVPKWLPEEFTETDLVEELGTEIEHSDRLEGQVRQLNKMAEVLDASINAATRETGIWRMALLNRASKWQGLLAATYPIKLSMNCFAVNDDASILATTSYYSNFAVTYRLPSGDILAKFGSKGSKHGQFDGPLKLCFSPSGTLVIADSRNSRVQEMTVMGEHVRLVGENACNSPILHVVCNSEVIVATCADTPCFLVFDWKTGVLLRRFGFYGPEKGQIRNVSDITLSCHGSAFLVSEITNCRVSAFDFLGNFLHCWDASAVETVYSAAELPDGRVLVVDAGNRRVAILSQANSETPTFLGACNAPVQVRYVGKFVFVSEGKCVHCFC